MKKVLVFVLLSISVITFSGCSNDKVEYTNISNEELVVMLENKSDYQFVDVRTYLEYQEMKISGFDYIMDVYIIENDRSSFSQLDKDKPIVLMCNSGNRSVDATAIFYKEGFTEIYNLTDGIQGWINDGYETE